MPIVNVHFIAVLMIFCQLTDITVAVIAVVVI